VPLSVLRRKLSGINDSIVASSIWKPSFRKRLDTHPRRKQVLLSYSVPLCDACRISGRIATISFRLEGLPYDRNTFEKTEVRWIKHRVPITPPRSSTSCYSPKIPPKEKRTLILTGYFSASGNSAPEEPKPIIRSLTGRCVE
jgi:hypothetical protein